MHDQVLETDFLIVGGGIQGVTLLHQLREAGARRILLVSRDDLGVGETLHGHGYMHHGYMLPAAGKQLAKELADCGAWWWRRIEATGLRYLSKPPSYYGVSRDAAPGRVAIWDELGVAYQQVPEPPDALRDGSADCPSTRLFCIRDRLVSMPGILEGLAAPLQDQIVRAELTGIALDEAGRRVVNCRCSADDGTTFVVRPRMLLLANGRFAQPMIRGARTPRGAQPLSEPCRELNNIRFVPMLLIRGRHLPRVTAYLESHAIWMLAHPIQGDESMWIVTYLRDHECDRSDFDQSRESVPGAAVRESIERLCALVPEVRRRLRDDLRFSFYSGGKTDNPAGGNGRHIEDCGVVNLRVLWPGMWSLALANARDIVDELEGEASWAAALRRDRGSFDPRDFGLTPGVPVGEERRLTNAQSWLPFDQFASKTGIV